LFFFYSLKEDKNMATTKSRAARAKRTKDDLISELESLEQKLQGAEAPDPVAQTIAKENATKTLAAVKGLSVDNIVTKGATFGLEVQRTVAGLTEQAVLKAEELTNLQEAIAIESAELERLYDLDVVSASVQALIAEHTTKKAGLEQEILVARRAWEEEKTANQRFVTQRNTDLEQNRRREQAEYDYKTAQERGRVTEEFAHKMAISERDQAERDAQATKVINERLALLTAQEKDIQQFRARIEGLDAELKAKSDAAVAIATNSLKKELLGNFALEKKDLDLAIQLQIQKNGAVEQANAKLIEEVTKLHAQLDAARQEVRDIAKSAVEGASGQVALQKVMEVRQDNGGQPRGKS
jgi:hypothetical protein